MVQVTKEPVGAVEKALRLASRGSIRPAHGQVSRCRYRSHGRTQARIRELVRQKAEEAGSRSATGRDEIHRMRPEQEEG